MMRSAKVPQLMLLREGCFEPEANVGKTYNLRMKHEHEYQNDNLH